MKKEKICAYLLSPVHPVGSRKAPFFIKFGFCIENWEDLAAALRLHGQTHEVCEQEEKPTATKYVVEGELTTADGRRPRVCTIWQVDVGQIAPRFITAYPLRRDA